MISVHRRAICLENEQVEMLSEPVNRLNVDSKPSADTVSAAANVSKRIPM